MVPCPSAGYVVLVEDSDIGEFDVYGPYDGPNAVLVAGQVRDDLDAVRLPDVAVRVVRWHRRATPADIRARRRDRDTP